MTEHVSGSPLAVSVHTNFAEVEGRAECWDRFLLQQGADICWTFDWLRTWWGFYGRHRRLRLFVAMVDQEIVGLVPMLLDRHWLGPMPFVLARLLGSDFGQLTLDPPVDARWAQELFAALLLRLRDTDACDAIALGPASPSSVIHDQLQHVVTANRAFALAQRLDAGPMTEFALSATFDDYLRQLSQKTRSNFKRESAALTKQFAITVDVLQCPTAVDAAMHQFANLHQTQWRAQGKLGHFGDWPAAFDFHLALARRQAAHGRFRMHRIVAAGEAVCLQYCYALGRRWSWVLPARRVDASWEHFGLGSVGLLRLIESAIADGAGRMGGGPGHYEYKLQRGGTEYRRTTWILVRDRYWSRLGLRLFTAWSNLLHLVYYRLWFCRLAPRLPFRRRGLWRAWIRTRL
jgi:hypothetical protein